ncbi:MAG: methyltransferase domain-containing protein [Chloroflexi bacterium]|nr:methyltransferase domain-containing protein [Chloroflexota bacterium]
MCQEENWPAAKPSSSALGPFDAYAEQYDAWYDSPHGQALLASEVACLRLLLGRFKAPYLEVGVGTGRFAKALGIACGIDPAARSLAVARRRGVNVALGVGENLPLRAASFGAVLVAFTLCFVSNPTVVLGEARRVLKPCGGLVLGLLPRGSPWADWYARRGAQGHPLYRSARFFTLAEVQALLEQSGFRVTACRSTLFQPPGLETYAIESPIDGCPPGGGFVGLAAVPTGKAC